MRRATRKLGIGLALLGAAAALAGTPLHAQNTDALETRLEQARQLAGLTPLEGPGLAVTLRPSPRRAPRGVDPSKLQIHETDVNAVLNALRAGGAEALAVAGSAGLPERVLATTAIRDDVGGLRVNGVTLRPPYQVLAIGGAAALRKELLRADGVVSRSGLEALQMIAVEEPRAVRVPAARVEPPLRFAHAPGSAPSAPVAPPVTPPVTPPAGDHHPQPGTVTPASGTLFGGKGLTRYHRAGCRFGERIEAGSRVSFASVAAAQRAGRTPCPYCHPDR